eukprot:3563208-Pyramimonas_sp.AAC.1
MLHQPSGAARGQASDIYNEARELLRLRTYMSTVLSQVQWACSRPPPRMPRPDSLGTQPCQPSLLRMRIG